MPRACTVCAHTQRAEIEAAIITGVANRPIASQFGIGYKSVERHANEHIADTIKQSQAAKDEMLAMNAASELKWVQEQVHTIYQSAIEAKVPDLKLALQATGEIRRWAELWAELEGEINRGTTIELVQHPEWVSLREIIFQALAPWPDARVAVARAIMVAGGQDNAQISS